jgi:hypothetical protein
MTNIVAFINNLSDVALHPYHYCSVNWMNRSVNLLSRNEDGLPFIQEMQKDTTTPVVIKAVVAPFQSLAATFGYLIGSALKLGLHYYSSSYRENLRSAKEIIGTRGRLSKNLPPDLYQYHLAEFLNPEDAVGLRIAGSISKEDKEITLYKALNRGATFRDIGCETLDKALAFIQRNGPHIKTLDLSVFKYDIDEGVLEEVARHSPNLQSLDLTNCHLITDTGLGHLRGLSSLQNLDLWGCNRITDTGLGYLSGLSSLQNLDLAYCRLITDTGLDHLSELISLQNLNLTDCDLITDTGLGHLRGLSSLQKLDLCCCNRITDTGLAHLSELRSLQNLSLWGCDEITDTGLGHLSERSSLQNLKLVYCHLITDTGLGYLSGLRSLQNLDLRGCYEITDRGLDHLSGVCVQYV